MARLTQAMKDMIAAQQVWHATVSKDGTPNVAPKRSTRVLDDETLIFNEGTGGTAELQSEGPLYDQAAALSAKNNMPAPKGVVLLHIREIHSLKPGPGAGKPVPEV